MINTLTHYKGRYLSLHETNGWEYVRRRHRADVVIVVALTPNNELLMVEQYRQPVDAHTIELPAGLVGDVEGQENEALEVAAFRELEEETGFRADSLSLILSGPTSAGLTDEMVHIFRATGLIQTGSGGGVEGEAIRVHQIPLSKLNKWLTQQVNQGRLLDPKIYAALFWLQTSSG